MVRSLRPVPSAPNARWAMAGIHDSVASGQTSRILRVVDVCTRECVALVPQHRFRQKGRHERRGTGLAKLRDIIQRAVVVADQADAEAQALKPLSNSHEG